jgi:hypothetical protein
MLEIIVELPDLYGDSINVGYRYTYFSLEYGFIMVQQYYYYVHMNRTAAMVAIL